MKSIRFLIGLFFYSIYLSGFGQDLTKKIEGSSQQIQFGFSTAISDQKNRIVVGAPVFNSGKGRTQAYIHNETEWVFERFFPPIGGISVDENSVSTNGRLGSSVAVSGNGNYLAFGAPILNGEKDRQGRVIIYSVTEEKYWYLDGRATDERFGSSLAFSKNGTSLAIGSVPNTTDIKGRVTIYDLNNSGEWKQRDFEELVSIAPGVQEFGHAVVLSNDGNRLTVSSKASDFVKTYNYFPSEQTWRSINSLQGSIGDDFGASLATSGDGKILAIGAPGNNSNTGYVSIYSYQGESWQLLQKIIGKNTGDLFGTSVSLSDNGKLLAVGVPEFNTNQGKTTLYAFRNGTFVKEGDDIVGEANDRLGSSVSLSESGTTLVVGSPSHTVVVPPKGKGKGETRLNAGMITIYEYTDIAPLDLSLTTTTIAENNAVGVIVGALSTQDPNTSDTFTYALVSGAGDTDNAAFSISGANLLAAASFDFETKNSYSILVQTTDAASNTLTKTFTIAVSDLDEDTDADGIPNSLDNCPSVANASQADADSDGIGDPCDNAPNVANPDQRDTDSDGIGDVIDTDKDGDGVPDTSDAFPLDPTENTDTDGDLIGDNADPDDDNDGILDPSDNCPLFSNTDQADIDADGIGDVCDPDNDNDGFTDAEEIACGSDPLNASDLPLDTDNDNLPDCFDEDDDNDGYLDASDAFPLDATEWTDTDADGTGNNADLDDDNDKQLDADEVSCGSDPLLASSSALDTDLDHIPNCVDPDDDNDGLLDGEDVFPLDPTEWTDTDADGIGNNADTDDDNDGYSDFDELACGSDPLDRFKKPADQDKDGLADCVDEDRDGDGYQNNLDTFPDNSSEWKDADLDGFGDNFDPDDDNDGYLDASDAFPLDPTEWADADADGIGDNADPDDNNDGFTDEELFISGVITPNSASFESTWKIVNIERFPTHSIRVYNKSGQEVFSSTNYKNDWRGTLNNSGQLLPAGPYYYKISLNYSDQKSGWLYLTY